MTHTLGLIACLAALHGLDSAISGLPGLKPDEHPSNPFEFAGNYLKFFIFFFLALTTIPAAAVLWLLTKRRPFTFSQSLLLFLNSYNLYFGALLLVFLVAHVFLVPYEIYGYLSGTVTPTADPVGRYLISSHASPVLAFPFNMALLYIVYRTSWVVPANLVAGALNLTFWQGLWRHGVSVLPVIIILLGIPYLLLHLASGGPLFD